MLHAVLASSTDKEDMDAIDKAVTSYYAEHHNVNILNEYTIVKHFPFNPVDKKVSIKACLYRHTNINLGTGID